MLTSDTAAVCSDDINNLTNRISNIFISSAQTSFTRKQNFIKTTEDKKWFGPDCLKARNDYHLAKKTLHANFSELNQTKLRESSKAYKQTMNKYILRYKCKTRRQLRSLKQKQPKDFWKLLNSLEKRKSNENITLDSLYQYFKNLNSTGDTEGPDNDIHFDINDDYEILNGSITTDEIRKSALNLRNNKSPSNDHIVNEYIKNTLDIFLPIYESLFNLIFDTGILPDSWLEGIILPIYKNKGEQSNPQNYRPITLLSCFGKLFTSVLNARLNKFIEQEHILEENQAGFRKGYSTTDHVFVLHSRIEIMKNSNKNLFCCFIDFSQAFDSVWRVGLWQKLIKMMLMGKCLELFTICIKKLNHVFH